MSEKNTAEEDGGTSNGASGGPKRQSLATSEVDLLFEVLADRRRRLVLGYLESTDDGVAEYDELVDHVLAGTSTDAAEPDARKRIAADLHHRHLPKLADSDLIEYDRRSETVRYRGAEAVPELLDLASDHDAQALGA